MFEMYKNARGKYPTRIIENVQVFLVKNPGRMIENLQVGCAENLPN